MTQPSQRVHLADLANHIGWTYEQPNPDRSVTPMTVTGVEHSGLHMVVGLDQFRMTMPRSRVVRLSSAKDKVAHRHCGMRCRGLHDHATTDVAAGDLASHIGRLAFIDGGAGPGP
ncbi:MAG: hypothetical protein IT514_15590, partial [Burkholderiales bacterium]|nr:hypothetical protein [Burkholderiales bacterium]